MSACRWTGSDQPRAIVGRHGYDCPGEDECRGCQPCTAPHCRVCGISHADGTCAECLAETRANLHEIARMCDALPEEAKHRGIEGEAMMLLGPTADVEARQHAEASYLAGRLPEGWLETGKHGKECPLLRNEACVGCEGDERHPLTVLASWQDLYAAEFEHEITRRATIEDAVGYLDRNLSYAAEWPHAPFEDFARDLRRCVAHLESVLHDGEQIEEGVPCMACGRTLIRKWGDGKREDGWECKRCRSWSTEAQYRLAVKADYIHNAEWLTDVDMVARFEKAGLSAATDRTWALDRPNRPAVIRKRRHSERTEFNVADVEAHLARRKDDVA